MRGLTIDQMGTMYWTYKDITPGAWMLPWTLPRLTAFYAAGCDFDNTNLWYDIAGGPTPNNLTKTGAPTIGQATTWPAALVPYMSLDGTNDYFTVNDGAYISIAGDLTIGAWVYADVVNKYQAIVNKGKTSDDTRSYHLYLRTDGTVRILVSDDGTDDGGHFNSVIWSSAISAQAWHFICARFDAGSSLSLRVDNAAWQSTTSGIIASINDNANALRIGELFETSGYRFDGRIAQVWMCAYHVPADVIDRLYKAQAPDFGTAFP